MKRSKVSLTSYFSPDEIPLVRLMTTLAMDNDKENVSGPDRINEVVNLLIEHVELFRETLINNIDKYNAFVGHYRNAVCDTLYDERYHREKHEVTA